LGIAPIRHLTPIRDVHFGARSAGLEYDERSQPLRSRRNRTSQASPEDLIIAETGSTYGTIASSLAISFASRVV